MLAVAMMVAYFLVLLVLGVYSHKKTKSDVEDYFLAGRSFGPVVLFFTLAATSSLQRTSPPSPFSGLRGRHIQMAWGSTG